MLLIDAYTHVETMLDQRTPLEYIEVYVENLALPAEDAAGLRLYASAEASRRARRDPRNGVLPEAWQAGARDS